MNPSPNLNPDRRIRILSAARDLCYSADPPPRAPHFIMSDDMNKLKEASAGAHSRRYRSLPIHNSHRLRELRRQCVNTL